MSDDRCPELPIVLAITGASGAVYAARLVQLLARANALVHLVVSPSGSQVVWQELGITFEPNQDGVRKLLNYRLKACKDWIPLTDEEAEQASQQIQIFGHSNYMSPMASGSFRTRGMVICPCSGSTLSGIVHAASNNLVVRAADVHLKEHRKLILVNRETPLSAFQLENMHRAAVAGAVVLPAMPGWYHGVESLLDLIDFVVARILDHLQVEHQLMRRWGES